MNEYLTVPEAALAAKCHPETIRQALRDKSLHGVQRIKRGTWKIERECLGNWVWRRPCEHNLASGGGFARSQMEATEMIQRHDCEADNG